MSDIIGVETNIFDIEEIYPNCTVQVLKNSVTGEVSVGWWKNRDDEQDDGDDIDDDCDNEM